MQKKRFDKIFDANKYITNRVQVRKQKLLLSRCLNLYFILYNSISAHFYFGISRCHPIEFLGTRL